MRRFLPLSLGAVIIISMPLVAFSLVHASPGPGAPAHWSTARDISESPDGIAGPRIAVDNSGYLHLIWIDDRTGSGDLYYTKSTDGGGSWSAFDPITTTSPSSTADMDIEPDGTVHVVWTERESYRSYYVEHAEKLDGGGWLTSTVTIQPSFQLDPAIALDENYIYVVWQKQVDPYPTNIWYSYKAVTDTTWATPLLITDTGMSSFAPDVAMDSNGSVHAVWQEQVNEGTIWYSKGSWNGSLNWSPVITVSEGLTGSVTPAIAVGSDDYVHVVWGQKISEDEQYVYYANFPYDNPSLITAPVKVFTEAAGVSTEAPTYLYPRVAIRGENEIHVVWHGKAETDITDQIWYAVSEDKGNSWSTPIKISQDPARQALAPDIALDEKIGHVVWQGKEGEIYQVMYSRGFPYAIYLPVITKSYSGG